LVPGALLAPNARATMNLDIVAFLELERFDDGGGQANRHSESAASYGRFRWRCIALSETAAVTPVSVNRRGRSRGNGGKACHGTLQGWPLVLLAQSEDAGVQGDRAAPARAQAEMTCPALRDSAGDSRSEATAELERTKVAPAIGGCH